MGDDQGRGMGARQSRPYSGAEDLQSMIDLLVAVRPADRIADYPSIVDLHEELALTHVQDQTRLWFDADRLVGFAFVDPYNNLHFEFDLHSAGTGIASEIVPTVLICVGPAMLRTLDQVGFKWVTGLGIAVGVLALLVIGARVGWRMLVTFFQRRYYREGYAPIELAADDIGETPPRHHLDDVPWIATQESYCQANTLAMVAAQHGIDAPTSHCNFLMGFTYGAVEVPGRAGINPFTDPEHGFAVAAPYLGLVRHYYVTHDPALYLDALRHFLSRGYAVRVALDAAVLYDLERQLPHSDLLVGYDETGFYYYETVGLPEFPCHPRHSPPGEEGLWISDRTLLDAVLAQARMFAYPWRYSFTLFESGPIEDSLEPIWTRNGNLLLGGAPYGPRQGADAIEKLADVIEKRGARVDISEVRWGLEAAVFTRHGNAAYLRTAFADRAEIKRAADRFDRAGDAYARALASLQDGIADRAEADQIAAWLRDAAVAERKVGQVFLAQGR